MAVTDSRSEILKFRRGHSVGRVVDRMVRGQVSGAEPARRGPWPKGVEVAEEVVAILDAHRGEVVLVAPRDRRSHPGPEGPLVDDSRRGKVAGDEIRDAESFATLHQRRMVRTADLLTGVVHVDVHVAAEPAIGAGSIRR